MLGGGSTGGATPATPALPRGPAPSLGGAFNAEAAVVAVDGGACLVDARGRGPTAVWRGSGAPAALAATAPYAVALLPGGVEVRALAPGLSPDPVQLLPYACMAVVSPGGGPPGSPLVVAGGGRAVLLTPAPFDAAAAAATAAGRHRDALELAALAPPPTRPALLDRARAGLAAALFASGEYEEALAQLALCESPSPASLLRLFPSLAPAELVDEVEKGGPGGEEGGAGGGRAAPPPEPTGTAFRAAVDALLPYLLSFRARLASKRDGGQEGGRGVQKIGGVQEGGGGGPGGGGTPGAADAATTTTITTTTQPPTPDDSLASLVDTAILKAMLVGPDTGAALRFVSRPNRVRPADGEAALRAAGRYSELVALFQSVGRHEAALDVLQALSQAPGSLDPPPTGAASDLGGVTGAWAAVRYLHAVGGGRADLVHVHARWIVAADPEAGVQMLLDLKPPPAPDAALAVLRSAAPGLAATYLEQALAVGVADHATHDKDLLAMYIKACLPDGSGVGGGGGGGGGDGGGGGGAEHDAASGGTAATAASGGGDRPPTPPPATAYLTAAALPRPGSEGAYAKLMALAATSPYVDPGRTLLLLPAGALLALRATLLERTGRIADALRRVGWGGTGVGRVGVGGGCGGARAGAWGSDPQAPHRPRTIPPLHPTSPVSASQAVRAWPEGRRPGRGAR